MAEINISMLGEFSVNYKDNVVNEHSRRSKKMWQLLEYLITFHDREIAQSELIELFWSKSESDNPVSALKTQLHRLRAALDELSLPEGTELILSTTGSYGFNNTLKFSIDFEEFERLFKQSALPGISEKERLRCYLSAIELYKGDFLPKAATEQWVMPINAYYHSLYLRIVHKTAELLFGFSRHAEVIDLCRRALLIDPIDEQIHIFLIRSLTAMGDLKEAKKQYLYVIDLYYNHQGINPSPELIALYKDTIKTDKLLENDMETIIAQLEEPEKAKGAFFCELEFFRHIYQLEKRDSVRQGTTLHVCLITVADRFGAVPEQKMLNRVSAQLYESISLSLRASDVFARYSVSQYIILLPNTTDEISEMVMERITKRYHRDHPRSPITLTYKFK